jgi:UTP--glucose-1-phosphate uridylyltransferase
MKRAVIPAAGLGTRLFPASQAVKKELFPVVGPDGVARALVHYHVADLVSAGIEEIAIIIQAQEEEAFRGYFRAPPAEYLRRLEKQPALHAEALALGRAAGRIRYVAQREQEGYGHAVFQAREFARGEPFLLLLGDHLFRGANGGSCARALAGVFARGGGRSVSAVNRIAESQLGGYGTIAGRRVAGDPRLIEVSEIVEKPSPAVARARLRVDGLAEGEWLGWFGMHALAPSIFDVLAGMIRDGTRDGGEFQLTRAQEIQRQREGYLAWETLQERRFDFGTPADFLGSLAAFARP